MVVFGICFLYKANWICRWRIGHGVREIKCKMTPEALGYATRRIDSPLTEMRKMDWGSGLRVETCLYRPLDLATHRSLVTLTMRRGFFW